MTHDQLIFCICKLDNRVQRADHGTKFTVVMPILSDGTQAGPATIIDWDYDFDAPEQEVIEAYWAENSKLFDIDPWCIGLENAQRQQRDRLLVELDPTVSNPLRWNSFTPDQQQALVDYRQALLDVPQQAGFPENVVFPDKPDFIKHKEV